LCVPAPQSFADKVIATQRCCYEKPRLVPYKLSMKVFVTILLLFLNLLSNAAILEVGAGKQFKTIRTAIDASKDDDVIIIHAGIYGEGEIIITKKLTLKGLGWPVLDGQNKSQVLRIESNDVIVEGLELRNSGYSSTNDWGALKVIGGSNVTIRNNRFLDNAFGVYFQNVTNSSITDNIVKGNTVDEVNSGNAIHCWKSSGITIRNNMVSGHRDGIYFEFVNGSLIENNTSANNLRYGIHFMFSNNDVYRKNTFRSNGAGVAVMFSNHVTMIANHFEESWGAGAYGILMKEISDGLVERNTFLRNTVGIYMEGTNRISISKNVFRNNGWAMRIQSSCQDNEIFNNNYIGNTFDVGTNGELQLNVFKSNYWDKYEGYDLNKDGTGDIHYMPVSLYSMIVEKMPSASLLLRSFIVSIMDKAERLVPSITPVQLKDDKPLMKPFPL
jgi:nitrous oxidase accessory protein